jgi:hypothetical protein
MAAEGLSALLAVEFQQSLGQNSAMSATLVVSICLHVCDVHLLVIDPPACASHVLCVVSSALVLPKMLTSTPHQTA